MSVELFRWDGDASLAYLEHGETLNPYLPGTIRRNSRVHSSFVSVNVFPRVRNNSFLPSCRLAYPCPPAVVAFVAHVIRIPTAGSTVS